MSRIAWEEKLAFVGFVAQDQERSTYKFCVKIGIPINGVFNGRVAFGYSNISREEAIADAAIRIDLDWSSIDRKITETQWNNIAHQ
jgi:hypothetical protein